MTYSTFATDDSARDLERDGRYHAAMDAQAEREAVVELIDLSRKRLSKPYSWTQHHLALRVVQTELGSVRWASDPNDPQTTCWCLIGSLGYAGRGLMSETVRKALKFIETAIAERGEGGAADEWNDAPGTTREDVLQVLARARALALAETEGVLDV